VLVCLLWCAGAGKMNVEERGEVKEECFLVLRGNGQRSVLPASRLISKH
jgi:hypothetical protein